MLVFYLLTKKIIGNTVIVQKIKKKLMWSSVFRSQIQTYLPTCLLTFEYFNTIGATVNTTTLPGSIIKLLIVLSLPGFSYYQLGKNKAKLDNPEF